MEEVKNQDGKILKKQDVVVGDAEGWHSVVGRWRRTNAKNTTI